MDVSSRELAAILAERLNHIVPTGFMVQSKDVNVDVYADGKSLGGSAALEILDDDDDRSVEEKIETAVQAVLSSIQDTIIETVKEPWPGTSPHGTDLPMPDCRVTGDQLRFWFGDQEAPVVSAAPIPLH
jgi:enolase